MTSSWEGIAPPLREVMERVCTQRQIDVVRLRAKNYGYRRIGVVLGIDESTVRAHWKAATKNIQDEVAAMRGVQ